MTSWSGPGRSRGSVRADADVMETAFVFIAWAVVMIVVSFRFVNWVMLPLTISSLIVL